MNNPKVGVGPRHVYKPRVKVREGEVIGRKVVKFDTYKFLSLFISFVTHARA